MNVLVIAPHADDEVLGCGGALIKHKLKGDRIVCVICTKDWGPNWAREKIDQKVKESQDVAIFMGFDKHLQWNFPTVKLDTMAQYIFNDNLKELIKQERADIVYTSFGGDLIRDHRIIYEATMVATRPGSGVKRVYAYENPETALKLTTFMPTLYMEISGEILEAKIKAMELYKTEIEKWPHPRSSKGIITLAEMRGMEAGFNYAEAFILARGFEK